jgi:hypothetical protein
MTFLSTLDAQTQLVTAFISRFGLENQFATYNNTNDPTYSIRLGIKMNIKNEQFIIDSANLYLISNQISPLIYNSALINTSGFVATPWANEIQVPNTVQYEASLLPPTSLTQLISAQGVVTSNILQVGTALSVNTQAVVNAASLPDTNPTKTQILNAATQELAATQTLFDDLTQTQTSLNQSIAATTAVSSPTNDIFSQDVRSFIHSVLIQKDGYDAATDDEAHMVMRKNVLDAFYTAKTPEDKITALARLNQAVTAMSTSVPITHVSTPFDPNAFFILSDELNNIDANILIASDNLYAAQISGSSAQISAAEIVYNDLTLEKTDLIDTMLGFRDSPDSPSVAYSSAVTVEDVVSTLAPAVNPFGSIPYLTGDSQAAASVLIPYTINNATSNQAIAASQQIAPPNTYYNIKTGTYVAASSISQSDIQSGIYISSRNVNPISVEQANAQVAINGYQIILNNTIGQLQASITAAQTTLTTNNVVLSQQIAANNATIASTSDQETINNLTIVNSGLVAQQQANQNIYNAAVVGYNAQIQVAYNVYNSSVEARNEQLNLALSAGNLPATVQTATSLLATFQNANDDVASAQQTFTSVYNNAVNNAVLAGSPDPSNPNTWASEDITLVDNAQTSLMTAQAAQQQSVINYASYVDGDPNPNGPQAMGAAGVDPAQTAAGVDPQQILAQVTANNLAGTNNTTSQAQTQSQIDSGNTATSINGSNVNASTGFSGVAGGGPFYLQFPTLQSISDFRMRNGISPYGQQDPDEIARHAIHFNIFQNTPPVPQAKQVGNTNLIQNVVPPTTTTSLGTFTIYPSNMDLNMTHNHNYEGIGDNVIASSINSVLDMVNGADALFTLGGAVLNSINKGSPQAIPQKMTRKLDTLDRYAATDKQEITTEFTLFTKDDFLNDVFRPLMFLTALSYPTRTSSGNLGQSLAQFGAAAAASDSKTIQSLGQLINQASQTAQTIDTATAQAGGFGPYRYFIVKNPEYISVRHASGLFYFPIAVIKNVTYEFHGPWYNYDGTPLQANGNFGQLINAGINSAAGQSLDQIVQQFQTADSTNTSTAFGGPGSLADIASRSPDDPLLQQYRLPYAFPTFATCSITYKNAVPLFREDFMNLYNGVGIANDASSVVTVSEVATQTNGQVQPPQVF